MMLPQGRGLVAVYLFFVFMLSLVVVSILVVVPSFFMGMLLLVLGELSCLVPGLCQCGFQLCNLCFHPLFLPPRPLQLGSELEFGGFGSIQLSLEAGPLLFFRFC